MQAMNITVESSNACLIALLSCDTVVSLPPSLYDIRAESGEFRIKKMSMALFLREGYRTSPAFRACGGSEKKKLSTHVSIFASVVSTTDLF